MKQPFPYPPHCTVRLVFLFGSDLVVCQGPPNIPHPGIDKRSGCEASGDKLRRQQHQRGNNNDTTRSNSVNHVLVGTSSPRLKGTGKLVFGSSCIDVVAGLWLFSVQGIIVIVFLSPLFIIIAIVTVGRRLSKVEAVSATTGEALWTTTASAAEVEVGTAWETSSTTREPASAAGEPAAAAEATLLAHHTEEDLGVDASHASHASTHAASKHVRGVQKIVTVVVTCSLPLKHVSLLPKQPSNCTQDYILWVAQSLVCFLHILELGLGLLIARVLVRV